MILDGDDQAPSKYLFTRWASIIQIKYIKSKPYIGNFLVLNFILLLKFKNPKIEIFTDSEPPLSITLVISTNY